MTNLENLIECPFCASPVEAAFRRIEADKYRLSPHIISDQTTRLREILISYWRWLAEGRPPKYSSYHPEVKGQFYYDDYHSHMEYKPEEDRYYFNIQISDSPEGDSWASGSFKISRGLQIEDVRAEYSRY